jgi:hypothetical protein
MSISIIKSKIIKKLNVLDKEGLTRLNQSLDMFIQTQKDNTEWKNLSPVLKAKIDKSILQLENGESIPFETAMKKIRKKYGINE